MITKPVVTYLTQNYYSHLRTANSYISILRERYSITEVLKDGNPVILHIEPTNYATLYREHSYLRDKYVISYCVWEATNLPECYIRSLDLVQEVWTCSEYCRSIISKAHPRVILIPHVADPLPEASDLDRLAIRRLLSYDKSCQYILNIGRTRGTRKNLSSLARAFMKTINSLPTARLVVKGLPDDPHPRISDSRIIYLPLCISQNQIRALFELADFYISPHHSEAWGLSLADAILTSTPVAATRYSGNLEFMSESNSFLLHCVEGFIPSKDSCGLFDTNMKWAQIEEKDIVGCFEAFYDGIILKPERCSMSKFRRSAIAKLIFQRIELILQLLNGVDQPEGG